VCDRRADGRGAAGQRRLHAPYGEPGERAGRRVLDGGSRPRVGDAPDPEEGYPAQTCLFCHNEKLPKKEAVTHNERGQWLVAEKGKRKAKEVDASWLKDYVEKKK
jgi:hypothetical protein